MQRDGSKETCVTMKASGSSPTLNPIKSDALDPKRNFCPTRRNGLYETVFDWFFYQSVQKIHFYDHSTEIDLPGVRKRSDFDAVNTVSRFMRALVEG